MATVLGVAVLVEAASFLTGAYLHVGGRLPLGFAVLAEPRILDAAIVEAVCGLLLAGSAYAVLAQKQWTWQAVLAAQVISLGGVSLGVAALAAGLGPDTASNALYHRVMLVVLAGGIGLLWTSPLKAALGTQTRESRDEYGPRS